MLIVRHAQMEALSAHARERFIRVVREHLTGAFPEPCAALGDQGLRARIEDGVARAGTFGLVAEQDIAGFIHFTFETGPDFDQQPGLAWAVAALEDPTLEPSERVDRLFAEWTARRKSEGTA